MTVRAFLFNNLTGSAAIGTGLHIGETSDSLNAVKNAGEGGGKKGSGEGKNKSINKYFPA